MIRIGGVPEHFNMPWHIALESGTGGLACEWHDYSTGTGAMLADLAAGKLDLGMLLTEGSALGLARELPIEAVSLYTTTPLIWGLHVPSESDWQSVAELQGLRFAISRYGSGSHLMSLALAMEQGWPVADQRFEIVDNLPGAIEAFSDGRADVFMWEHYTTEPAVTAGHFRRLGDFVSPWPAWVVCVNADCWRQQQQAIKQLLNTVAAAATQLKTATDAPEQIALRYGLEASAVAEWLAGVEWVKKVTPPQSALASARRMLEAAGEIS